MRNFKSNLNRANGRAKRIILREINYLKSVVVSLKDINRTTYIDRTTGKINRTESK